MLFWGIKWSVAEDEDNAVQAGEEDSLWWRHHIPEGHVSARFLRIASHKHKRARDSGSSDNTPDWPSVSLERTGDEQRGHNGENEKINVFCHFRAHLSGFFWCVVNHDSSTHTVFLLFLSYTPKNVVFWVMTPCGSCKRRRFEGMYRLHH
jgi:hypothetical protein